MNVKFSALRRALQVESLEGRRVLSADFHLLASDFDHDHDHTSSPFVGVIRYATESDQFSAEWDTGSAAPLTHRVTIQPVIVSDTNGSSTATYFGNATQQAIIHDLIDQVWAQAGIDIDWLSPNYWNNSFANSGSGTTTNARPNNDLGTIVDTGDVAGVGNADALILDMYFVDISAGFRELGPNYANGLAWVDGNGSTVHVGENLLGFSGGREVIARVVAHEIGHNLGLEHVDDEENLLDDGERLTVSQTNIAAASSFSIPLPSNNAPVVSSPIENITVDEGATTRTIDLSAVFSDPDGDALTYSISNTNAALLSASVSSSILTLTFASGQTGSANIVITAEDPRGASVSDEFLVTVADTTPNDSIELGTIDFTISESQSISGTTWFRLTASQSGFLSLVANYDASQGSVLLDLFSADSTQLATGSGTAGAERLDIAASQGSVYFARVTGNVAGLTLTAANLVTVTGSTIQIAGSDAADQYVVTPTDTVQNLTINSLTYNFPVTYTTIDIAASPGIDTLNVYGKSTAESVVLRASDLTLTGQGYSVRSLTETNTIYSGGGADSAELYDSSGNDTLTATPVLATLSGSGFSNQVHDFVTVHAHSTEGGADEANLFDSAGNDTYEAFPETAMLTGQAGSYSLQATGFTKVFSYALAGGNDIATFHDGTTTDHFATYPQYAFLYSITGEFFNYGYGFDSLAAHSTQGGDDVALLNDGPTNDSLVISPGNANFQSQAGGWNFHAIGFAKAYAYATTGTDSASFFDSAGSDIFYGTPEHSFLQGDGFVSYGRGFDEVAGTSANGGEDRSFLYDGTGNDEFSASPTLATLRGSGGEYVVNAHSFPKVYATANAGGTDTASFTGGSETEQFVTDSEQAYMNSTSASYFNYARGFSGYTAKANGGGDTAVHYDGAGDDVLTLNGTTSTMVGPGINNSSTGFQTTITYSTTGGVDTVVFVGTIGSDQFTGSPEYSTMHDTGFSYANYATGFARVEANSQNGAGDTASLFDSTGNDQVQVRSSSTRLSGSGYEIEAKGFPVVYATSSRGGVDTLDEESVDYLFSAFGNWA